MKTYVAIFTKQGFGSLTSYSSKSEAGKNGNSGTVFCTEQELAAAQIDSSELVEFYNFHHSDAKIKKFTDRATAVKRIFALAQAKAQAGAKSASEGATEAKVNKPKKEKSESSGPRGRKSEFEGKLILPAKDLTENPRREGTGGHKSMSIILSKPGISFSDFAAAGGRAQDLRWDIAHGSVTLKD